MIETLKKILGLSPKTDYKKLVREGAMILDVRTKREYAGGHIQGSINIAVDQLKDNLHHLKEKEKPIITCCASGIRSAAARNILKSKGYTNVYNGGSWMSLQNKTT